MQLRGKTFLITFSLTVVLLGLILLGLALVLIRKAGAPVTVQSAPAKTLYSFQEGYSPTTQAFNFSPALKDKPIPTNTWWSSALTGAWPDTLSAIPFSTRMGADGILTGTPVQSVSTDGGTATFQPDIAVTFPGSKLAQSQVSYDDKMVVTFDGLRDTGQAAYSLTMAEGAAFQFLEVRTAAQIRCAGGALTSDGSGAYYCQSKGQWYGLYPEKGGVSSLAAGGASLNVASGTVAVATFPAGTPSQSLKELFKSTSANEIRSSTAAYTADATSSTTSLAWQTSTGKPTMLVLLPHQQADGAGSSYAKLGTYATVRGTGNLVSGTTIVSKIQNVDALASLPTPKDDSFYTDAKLEAYLAADLQDTTDLPSGSYDGGKALFRVANLLDISKQANSPQAASFEAILKKELENWYTFTPGETGKFFYYDAAAKSMVASTPQFGSDTFNDHHFHYGYFLYASAVLARYDPDFVKQYGGMVDQLAGDIATQSADSDRYPQLRMTDPYEGHSWASGLAKFDDGNNQESVSEAINAWYGLMMWGQASGNQSEAQLGRALYNQEVQASLTYYFNDSSSNPFPAAYGHYNVSLLWSGKYDFATWFSDKPEAKHAILYLPFSGGSLYLNTDNNLKKDGQALTAELKGTTPTDYQDFLLMARSMYDPQGAIQAFSDTMPLDSSDSRSFLYTWLAFNAQR